MGSVLRRPYLGKPSILPEPEPTYKYILPVQYNPICYRKLLHIKTSTSREKKKSIYIHIGRNGSASQETVPASAWSFFF